MAERPLIITADDNLLEELLRIAAAAQVDVSSVAEASSRAGWRQASMVLLDVAAVSAAVARQLPKRPGVVAVAQAGATDIPWDDCIRLGVDRTVRLGESDDELVALLADSVTAGPGNGDLVAVIGACGGAGASVLATAIAAAGDRRGRRVLLADCDPWSPGLDVLLGAETPGGVHWNTLAAASGRLPANALHQALPALPIGRGRISVLCHGRPEAGSGMPSAVSAELVDVVIRSGRQAGDLLIADLARALTDLEERVLEAADLAVLVCPADVRACFGAARLTARLAALGVVPELVIRGPSPGGIGADDIADTLDLPLLASMRPQPFLARDLEAGRIPGSDRSGPLAKAAGQVLDRLAVAR